MSPDVGDVLERSRDIGVLSTYVGRAVSLPWRVESPNPHKQSMYDDHRTPASTLSIPSPLPWLSKVFPSLLLISEVVSPQATSMHVDASTVPHCSRCPSSQLERLVTRHEAAHSLRCVRSSVRALPGTRKLFGSAAPPQPPEISLTGCCEESQSPA
jgi:hypothetical protein